MLRPKRLAEELDVTPGLIYRAIRRGDLAAVRLGSSGSLRIPRKAKQAEEWESGAVTKSERREMLVDLVLLGWKNDRAGEAAALADLRSQGFDPLGGEKETR
jgi:hypothetical protein